MAESDDFLFGGGGASAKFDAIGDSISGTIESTDVRQQTDIATGKPLTWDNGDPRMQLVVVLQTTLRDGPDDDGKRAVYVKGSKKPGSQSLHDAVASAVKAAGASGLKPGGTLTITYTGTQPSETRGFNDRKLYAATYAAPDAAVSGGFLGTAAPGQQAATPAQRESAFVERELGVTAAGPTPEQIAAVKAAGLDPAVVFAGQQA